LDQPERGGKKGRRGGTAGLIGIFTPPLMASLRPVPGRSAEKKKRKKRGRGKENTDSEVLEVCWDRLTTSTTSTSYFTTVAKRGRGKGGHHIGPAHTASVLLVSVEPQVQDKIRGGGKKKR